MPLTELELLRDGDVVRVIPIGEDPVRLGRDLSNTVVLLDEDVSAHHAIVSRTAEGMILRDLRSTNGTFVNGDRVNDSRALADKDEIMLGESVHLRVRHTVSVPSATPMLQDLTAGIVYAIDDDRFRIGSADDCQVKLPEGPERAATLVVHPNDEVWLGTEDDDRPLSEGETFEAGGHQFKLTSAPYNPVATFRGRVPPNYPYALSVTLTGAGGAVANLRHTSGNPSHTVTSENRATLLYVLARQLQEDRDAGRIPDEAGWCDDEDVLVAVWGRAAMRQATSNYSVLLHRLRKELTEAGFDPWFIEKRRGAIRLRLLEVEIR